MKLSDYLVSQELTPAAFARRIQVGRMSVHRYISGERFPRPNILQRIFEATDGQVTPNDFVELPHTPIKSLTADTPNSEIAPSTPQERDDAYIHRPLYPWSRLQANEQQVLDGAYHDMMDQPPEGMGHSPVVQNALDTLGDRADCRGDDFMLDGRVTRIVRLIEEANVLRAEQGLPLLKYPGVQI